MNERLREIRQNTGKSQREFSNLFNIAQQTYANYELGKSSIPENLYLELAQMGINIHWLVTGEGSMFLDKDFEDNPEKVLTQTSSTFITPKGKSEIVQTQKGVYSVPILTQKLSAGPGQNWVKTGYSEETVPILERFIRRYPKEKLCAAEVRGDSMTGVMLFDGDIVIFVREIIEGNGIYVLTLRGEVYVKRLSFNPIDETVSIISENAKYKEIEVKKEDESLMILGKVIGWYHHHPY